MSWYLRRWMMHLALIFGREERSDISGYTRVDNIPT